MTTTFDLDPASLAYDDRGLVAAIAQDIATGAVLMLAWADREAIERTLATGEAHFWSRSRRQLWKKGETSGNQLRVRAIHVDCDRDSVLLRVDPSGPACHSGSRTCFDGAAAANPARLELGWLAAVVEARAAAADSASSYTARLLASGLPRVAQKVGEEAVETAIAAVTGAADFAEEAADLLYHLLVLCTARGVSVDHLAATLRRRHTDAGGGA